MLQYLRKAQRLEIPYISDGRVRVGAGNRGHSWKSWPASTRTKNYTLSPGKVGPQNSQLREIWHSSGWGGPWGNAWSLHSEWRPWHHPMLWAKQIFHYPLSSTHTYISSHLADGERSLHLRNWPAQRKITTEIGNWGGAPMKLPSTCPSCYPEAPINTLHLQT